MGNACAGYVAGSGYHWRNILGAILFQQMKTKIALLFYRVARWLAPSLFKWPDFTIKTMGDYVRELATEYQDVRNRYGARGIWLHDRITAAQRNLEYLKLTGAYEELKIEIRYDPVTVSRAVSAELKKDPRLSRQDVIAIENKRRLLEAVAAGLAQSARIDRHLYFRDLGNGERALGIKLYVRHEVYDSGARSQVGNYEVNLKNE